jgi:hypothetical protein
MLRRVKRQVVTHVSEEHASLTSFETSVTRIYPAVYRHTPQQFSQQGERCLSSPKRPDQLWGSHWLPFNGYRGFFLRRLKWTEREAVRLSASSAQIKNAPIFLHGMHADFTFHKRLLGVNLRSFMTA